MKHKASAREACPRPRPAGDRRACRRVSALLLSGLLCLVAGPTFGDDLVQETVIIRHQGLDLLGALRISEEAEPDRIILMVHGTLAHSGMEIMETFQALLSDLGHSSLAITLSLGVDKRTGMFGCDQPQLHRHGDAIGEIDAWFQWLAERGFARISLLGHSRGGNQAALFAAAPTTRRPEALILIAPMTYSADDQAAAYESRHAASVTDLIEQARRHALAPRGKGTMRVPGFLHCGESDVSPAAFLSYYAPEYEPDTPRVLQDIDSPVFVVIGTEDSVSPQLAGRIPECPNIEVFEVEGADHFFRDLHADDASEAIVEFLSGLRGAF